MSGASDVRDGFPVVCVIDDDPSVGRALTRLLRRHQFRAEAFVRPADFLQKVKARQSGESRCDALLLDINLGRTSGFDLHDRLVGSGLIIPTIFMTGRHRPGMREQVFRVGGKAYLIKPFEDDALITAVRMVLPPVV